MSLRQRLHPRGGEQLAVLEMHCSHARYVYNLGLEHRRLRWRGRRENTGVAQQMRELTEARKEFTWLREGSTVVQQGALRDLDRAYVNFFAGRARFPRFRSVRDPRQGFVVRDLKVRRYSKRHGALLVPKAGWVKFRLTYPWEKITEATSARITVSGGRWHVALTTPPRGKLNSEAMAAPIGIDRGVANTVATSDSEFFQAPTWSPREQKRFLALQRHLARQQKGSTRRAVTVAKIAAMHRKLADRRRDWVEQTTTELALRHRSVGIEKLRTANMVRRPKPQPNPDNPGDYLPNGASAKAKLNKAIYASCWSRFATRLADKTDVIEVNPRFTSQQCHHCGHIDARNRESQAKFRCVRCGNSGHADVHAAMNIRDRALRSSRHPPGDTRHTGEAHNFDHHPAAA
ncbi:transposase [Mycobacterium koreense]|uniref:Uncharacterized protein n=1 Tax=Mycolicibacillus koreensis TaxID=1069220 RepID=A0A7I7SB63_9MYCO|nr:RNA-guided endonuclease TnpB family protein [Mycolicibacillus koreensis]MCV7247655.1 transposase [Mycolicibacillus koreensis]OSC30612.1 hypothetical protein B8W67_16890 [Mycolicibacillus koreensis]BBY54038.1 transposase [Mycolicibacillus koreensis]